MMARTSFITGVERIGTAILVVSILMIAGCGTLHSKEPVQSKADKLFADMSSSLQKAQTLQFKIYALYDDFEESGIKYKRGMTQVVTVQRPNRIHFVSTADDGTVREGWYDGETFSVALPLNKTYVQLKVGLPLDGLLDLIQDEYNIDLPSSDILYSDVGAKLKENILSTEYLGEKRFDGMALDHLSVETTPGDLQIWLSTVDGKILPRRLVIDFVAVKGQPQYMASYQDWVLDAQVDEAKFVFTPPEGYEKIDPPKAKSAEAASP